MENSPKLYEDTQREIAPEANQLHGKTAPSEEIGRFLLSTEAYNGADGDRVTEREAAINKRVETMSRQELLDISGQISIEGTNLRKIYETHLIGERGLRRVVAEYLRSGDTRSLLQFELLQHEIDFERDPQLRDKVKRQIAVSGDKALDNLLQKAGLSKPGEEKESLTAAAADAFKSNDEPTILSPSHRRLLDIGLVGIILILSLLVIILAVRRG